MDRTISACARRTPTLGARLQTGGTLALLGALFATPLLAQDPPRTVQPGAPGQESRIVAPGSTFEWPEHVEADVHFMQMMIGHHAQALQMSELVPDRTGRDDVRLLAHRIHLAQFDEIALMARWLHDRGEEVPPEAAVAWSPPEDHGDHGDHGDHAAHHPGTDYAGHAAHHAGGDHAGHGAQQDPHAGHGAGHDHASMPGMLTPAQLEELAAATGAEFDRLFLEFMIYHHEGAIIMVRELFASPAGGQEGEAYQFAAHVDSDQRIEIERMRQMLARGR
jgi:uncharacterized protein (DUF305 family)